MHRALDDVVGEAGPQAGGRDLLAPGVREHHDRHVEVFLAHRRQHLQPVGPAQLIVGDDGVGVGARQRFIELVLVAHLDDIEVGEFGGESASRQEAVLRAVVDDQHPRRHHIPSRSNRGGSFSISQ